jgi:2-polyprenyl-3-methyl-5-hydroxy-6-metoxy-1,4-benzoquinol methylase
MTASVTTPTGSEDVSARCKRARALLARGDLASAAAVAEETLRGATKNVEALVLAADVNLAGGSVEGARAILTAALLVDGENESVWARLGELGGAYPKKALPLSRITESRSFFHQALSVRYVPSRKPFFVDRLRGKRVLHVGCVDHPIFQPQSNLHIYLDRHAGELHGCDSAVDGIPELARHVKGPIFAGLDEVLARGERYDVVLAPEVIEHVPNAHDFLSALFRVSSPVFIITAPNFKPNFAQSAYKDETFEELVHPDHKCYFSPYTLLKSVAPFVDAKTDGLELFLLENHHSVCVCLHRG